MGNKYWWTATINQLTASKHFSVRDLCSLNSVVALKYVPILLIVVSATAVVVCCYIFHISAQHYCEIDNILVLLLVHKLHIQLYY